jgi:anti-sigma factor RsiW
MNHDYIKEFNLIDQYALGKLAADEAEEFEDHFIDCPECVEQLNITRSFIRDLKGLAIQETLLSGNRPAAPKTRRWHLQLVPLRSWAVIACSCILVAGVFAFLAIRRLTRMEAELRQTKEEASAIRQQYQRELETAAESEKQQQQARQQLAQRLVELEQKLKTEGATNQPPVRGPKASEVNFPIYALVSLARGQAPAPVEIALPASSSRFALSIPVEDRKDFSAYRVKILDHRGVTVLNQGGFKPDAYHTLSLGLNSNFLTPGTYDLRVEGLTPPNKWDIVGSYPFRITKQR